MKASELYKMIDKALQIMVKAARHPVIQSSDYNAQQWRNTLGTDRAERICRPAAYHSTVHHSSFSKPLCKEDENNIRHKRKSTMLLFKVLERCHNGRYLSLPWAYCKALFGHGCSPLHMKKSIQVHKHLLTFHSRHQANGQAC